MRWDAGSGSSKCDWSDLGPDPTVLRSSDELAFSGLPSSLSTFGDPFLGSTWVNVGVWRERFIGSHSSIESRRYSLELLEMQPRVLTDTQP